MKDEGKIFTHHEDAKNYLEDSIENTLEMGYTDVTRFFQYAAVFSDGNIFDRDNLTSSEVLEIHKNVGEVAEYFTSTL